LILPTGVPGPDGLGGRGFLTATLNVDALDATDGRRRLPRFAGDAVRANEVIIDAVRAMAEAKHVPAAQAALAWVYAQAPRLGVPVAPIPGTKRVPWLEQNAAALGVSLSRDDLAALDSLSERVVGGRY
jgi:aryl-alcohol dehydrogenase-like predicted oxidoreductase